MNSPWLGMKKTLTFFFIFGLSALLCQFSFADDEAGNRPYVKASPWGSFYAKSIPAEGYGLKGKTKVYQVTDKDDLLVQEYDWYSPNVFLEGFSASPDTVCVVQTGAWSRGYEASSGELALAFYKTGKLLKSYSTLDIAGTNNNVSSSESHYTVIKNLPGFRRSYGNKLLFDAEAIDGRMITFDTDTGEIITKEQERILADLYEAEIAINQLKWEWREANKSKFPEVDKHIITEEELKTFNERTFPTISKGYRYVPGAVFQSPSIETEKPAKRE